MTKDYIESQEYINDMLKGITLSQEDYLKFHYDAEPRTANYTHRHNVIRKKLGTWRWKSVFQFKDILSPIIFSKDLRGIDFGGSQRPKPDGHFIAVVPSYSCKRWHANTGNWMGNEATKGTPGALAALHKHTFVLSKTNWEFMGLNSPVEIDVKLKKYFDLKIVEYTGDNSIFILGTNKK